MKRSAIRGVAAVVTPASARRTYLQVGIHHGAMVLPGMTVSTADSGSFPSSTTMCRSPFTSFRTCTFPDGHRIVRLSTDSESARPKWTTLGACDMKVFAG